MQEETNHRFVSGNACYHSVLIFCFILFYLKTMIRKYRIIIMPVLYVSVQLGFSQFGKKFITMFENKGAEEDI
jgi:hypothetical protein